MSSPAPLLLLLCQKLAHVNRLGQDLPFQQSLWFEWDFAALVDAMSKSSLSGSARRTA